MTKMLRELKKPLIYFTGDAMRKLTIALCFVSTASFACEQGVVPDQSPGCTPGLAASTDITDICSHEGGTYSQRHRLNQNPETKREVLERYSVPWKARSAYEDDHDVPLCLGGSDSIQNRWPQPRDGKWNAGQKDKLEALMCRLVCQGKATVDGAQAVFLAPADWRAGYCTGFPEDPACAELKP